MEKRHGKGGNEKQHALLSRPRANWPSMLNEDITRPYDPMTAPSIGHGIFYECRECGDQLDSGVDHAVACTCRNLVVDVDAGRISAKKPDRVFVIERRT